VVDCQYTFRWESINACPVHLSYTNSSKNVCSIDDTSSEFLYNYQSLTSQTLSVTDPHSSNTYIIMLCGTAVNLPAVAKGCDTADTGVCLLVPDSPAKTIVKATHKLVITSHTPHTVEVVFTTGSPCGDGSNSWSATVGLQCSTRQSSTPNPVLVSSDNCLLDFVWQNSSFCLGEKPCSVTDDEGYVYNFDGLFSQKWTVSLNMYSIIMLYIKFQCICTQYMISHFTA